jgi:tetratricopeptide (TPR) repeat protein
MKSYSIVLLAAFLLAQRWTAQVSGRILDHEGKPLAGAQVTYTNTGQYTTGIRTGNPNIDAGTSGVGSVQEDAGNGHIYKTKTDKKGEFIMIGVGYGIYQIVVTDSDGKRVYFGKGLIGDNNDPNVSNVLQVDLSTLQSEQMPAGGESSLAAGQKNKEQLALIRREGANLTKINRLIIALHSALGVQDWLQATNLLRQLIALDPNRWEFYQNLGTIQSNLMQYQDAVQTYQKGVEVAEKTLANTPDPAQVKTDISGMMVSEGDAYLRMDKLDDAVTLYSQAAAIAPNPAMAFFHACNAQNNRGTAAAAIDACIHAIAADPSQWDFYQVLGGAQNASGKHEDALHTFERGVQVAQKELAARPDSARTKNGMGQMLNAEGNLYSQMTKYDQAITAFAEAAKVSAYAALPYFNLCATLYNVYRMKEAVAACDHAIASDPTMSEAYYIKATAMFGEGAQEQEKYAVPEGTREALNKYLQLEPYGNHAELVREMLHKLDTTSQPRKPVNK